jgi:ribose 5-phosphate isomerase B
VKTAARFWGGFVKIAFGCDHGGYELKEAIKKHLIDAGHVVEDYGCYSVESVDYPDYGEKASRSVSLGGSKRAILICKSGIGMSIVANKLPGVRAALCDDEDTAESSRRHNDANVLVLSGIRTKAQKAFSIVDVWLKSPFEGGRHRRRVDKIRKLEKHRKNQ